MTTLGEALISLLEVHGVDTVFGIPGVHTIELYRGLARSNIRHVTPRHEQGAGFMADGYARVSGRPGVAFVITGPGLTNILTAMAQARADSIPMLVISGVNARATLGKGLGYLHEMPDQRGMMAKVALRSTRIERPEQLSVALAEAFSLFATSRPGPVHIEIPTDVMVQPGGGLVASAVTEAGPLPDPAAMAEATRLALAAQRPLILAGGGALRAETDLRRVAERLDAPVVTTINARGLMHRHPLAIHASPCLEAVRKEMAASDLVIAVGTEFGPTDYDMYANGGFVLPPKLIRIDIDAEQLKRRPATVSIAGDAELVLAGWAEVLAAPESPYAAAPGSDVGAGRAAAVTEAAWHEIGASIQAQVRAVETIRDALPGAIIVGDSTQPVYAANLWYDHDRPGGWFNAATGFGALGYGPPAAIGASLAAPDVPVVCLTGDGGFQFTIGEVAAAVETGAPVIFVVWNNNGYREIEESMRGAGVEPVGVSPAPPDFQLLAAAYGIVAEKIAANSDLAGALKRGRATGRPYLIEITVD